MDKHFYRFFELLAQRYSAFLQQTLTLEQDYNKHPTQELLPTGWLRWSWSVPEHSEVAFSVAPFFWWSDEHDPDAEYPDAEVPRTTNIGDLEALDEQCRQFVNTLTDDYAELIAATDIPGHEGESFFAGKLEIVPDGRLRFFIHVPRHGEISFTITPNKATWKSSVVN